MSDKNNTKKSNEIIKVEKLINDVYLVKITEYPNSNGTAHNASVLKKIGYMVMVNLYMMKNQ